MFAVPNLFRVHVIKFWIREACEQCFLQRLWTCAYPGSYIVCTFFAEMVFNDLINFRNRFTWCLPMLKGARKSVASIAFIEWTTIFVAFTKWTSDTRLASDMDFDVPSPVETDFMIGWFGWEERKMEWIKEEWGKKGRREKVSFGTEWKDSK